MQRKYAWAGLVVAGVALVGCTPAIESPEVVWKSGPPSGELEDNPWVEAVRASDLALNVAFVTRDYTTEDVRATTVSSDIGLFSSSQVSRAEGKRFSTVPGPTPMIPLSVDEESETQAVVTVCKATNWSIDADHPSVPEQLVGEVIEYRVNLDDGDRRAGGGAPTGEECDLTDASIGLFDPQPDPTETYSPDDVKAP